MRIAVFTDTYAPQVNGVAKTLQRYVEYLETKGIEYRLFVPKASKDRCISSQIQRFKSIPFHLYPECRLAIPNIYSIRKELESFRPDLIHIATPFNIGLAGLYYGKKLNIPIVGSFHTNFDHYLKYYDLQFLSKWIWKYMRWFHHSFKKTFVPSQNTRQELLRNGFSNLHIWSRGVDCRQFHPMINTDLLRQQYQITQPYILTYVGRIAPEKDLHILMDVSRQLPDSIKDQVHWLIAGSGPLHEELEANAPANMTFTGYLSGSKLTQVYAGSNLFVFPSTTETFGNVVLEAMACGTPVVGSKAGGVQEVIQDKKTGILCDPGSVQDFTDAITNLLENKKMLRIMGYEARQYALSRSWDTIFDGLLYEFADLLVPREYNYA
ncbi:glycosyltransferase family 1 protein [Halobacillus rhizosphaerae]|uniref:glycosyltransferase family 4 protein n=1 Tax=Halobacillus rhizosphaerae TaxID=3064889 RepID=UPI00398B1DBA